MKLRIKFRKQGPVRFIGHLDLMRFFQKMIRRAGLDVAYSQGFSPHQIMSFAAPLGVGVESNGEYVDVEMQSVTTSADMIKRLNEASVPGVEILSVKKLPERCPNAMASVAAASYTVCFRPGKEPSFNLKEALPEFWETKEIIYEKATKKGSSMLNLRPGIYEMRILEDGGIFLLVNASSSGNIKPSMVIEAFLSANGDTLQENALQITREDIFQQDETQLLSMGEFGEEIE